MAFLTIFSAPKPFIDPHVSIIQHNAAEAWSRLNDVEVILIGDEAGIPETARELGIKTIPKVERDKRGVPLVSSLMEIGHAYGDSPVLCYANADMILMSDMLRAARNVASQVKDFLLIGQRHNLALTQPFDFSGDWERRMREMVARQGKLFSPWGIDYFIFPRHLYTQVPDFTVGRVAWDNWMVYHARKTFGLAIDATLDILAVHQNHDYGHIPEKTLRGTEAARSNLAKAGGRKCIYNTLDTNRELIDGKIRHPQVRLVRILRKLEHLFINDKGKGLSWELAIQLQRLQRPIAIKARR